jgi:catechol 2,3-dioxygenase-like lactoylglutathione lyase family enzyme
MILNNLITSLLVKDYDEAIGFYSGKLGFVVAEDVPMGPDRWVTIALPDSHESVFALHVARSEGDLALVGKQGGTFPFLGIATDDCLADYQRLKALGVKFQGEPEARPYGTGVMLEDLYGNKIFLNQEPANEAAKN